MPSGARASANSAGDLHTNLAGIATVAHRVGFPIGRGRSPPTCDLASRYVGRVTLTHGMKVWIWKANGNPVRIGPNAWGGVGESNETTIWVEIEEIDAQFYLPEIGEAIETMSLPDYRPAMFPYIENRFIPGDFVAKEAPWRDHSLERELSRGDGVVRLVRAAKLSAEGTSGNEPEISEGRVLFLCGSNWLITSFSLEMLAWSGSRISGAPIARDALIEYAKRNWQDTFRAGDLANLFLRAIVESWIPALATVDERLQSLAASFMRGLPDPEAPTATIDNKYAEGLVAVQQVVNGLSRTLPRLARPATPMSNAWFPGRNTEGVAAAIQALIERTTQILATQRDDIRASFALIAAAQTSEQLALTRKAEELARATQQLAEEEKTRREKVAQAEQARSQKVQNTIDTVATALVVPGLVAAFFAAVPGIIGGCELVQGAVVLATMAAFAAVAFFGLRRYRSSHARSGPPEPGQSGGGPAS